MSDNTTDITINPSLTPAIVSPFDLLPIPSIDLTPEEKIRVQRLQDALTILGPAGGSVLQCPGNQIHTPEHERCPYFHKCELRRVGKAPEGELCPIEANYVATRFNDWSKEINKDPSGLSESERSFVSDITYIDLQTLRCNSIVSQGEAARLTQLDPKETHPETLEAISWQRVIHANVQRLDLLVTQRRMLLKDWMLTPEQKAKQAKWEGKSKGNDISSKQSALADKIRELSQDAQE